MIKPRLLVALTVLAGALPAGASAHVTLKNVEVSKEEAPAVSLNAPNEEEKTVTAITLTTPKGVTFLSGEIKDGWRLDVGDQRIRWRGGQLPPKSYTTLSFRMISGDGRANASIQPTYTFADGSTENEETVEVPLTKSVGGTSEETNLRTLAYVAAGMAAFAVVLSIVACFLALRVWLELPRSDPEPE